MSEKKIFFNHSKNNDWLLLVKNFLISFVKTVNNKIILIL